MGFASGHAERHKTFLPKENLACQTPNHDATAFHDGPAYFHSSTLLHVFPLLFPCSFLSSPLLFLSPPNFPPLIPCLSVFLPAFFHYHEVPPRSPEARNSPCQNLIGVSEASNNLQGSRSRIKALQRLARTSQVCLP